MIETSSSGRSSSPTPDVNVYSASMQELGRAIIRGSTLPVRFILFLSTLLWGIGLAAIPQSAYLESPSFHAMQQVGPQYTWSATFLLLAFCIAWRIVDYKSRMGWSHAINSFCFGFWTAVTFLRLWDRWDIWPITSTDLSLCVMALWVALRTSTTVKDRELA